MVNSLLKRILCENSNLWISDDFQGYFGKQTNRDAAVQVSIPFLSFHDQQTQVSNLS